MKQILETRENWLCQGKQAAAYLGENYGNTRNYDGRA